MNHLDIVKGDRFKIGNGETVEVIDVGPTTVEVRRPAPTNISYTVKYDGKTFWDRWDADFALILASHMPRHTLNKTPEPYVNSFNIGDVTVYKKDSVTCTCDRYAMFRDGCKCGAMAAERASRK